MAQKAVNMEYKQTFKTLKQSEDLFKDAIWGTGIYFKNKTLALPVKTLNLGEKNETVTFQIFLKSEISKPGLFNFISALVKLHTYILILMPLFYVLAKNFVDDRIHDSFSILISSLAMLFLYASLNIRNDINDHVHGYDRVNILKSQKPIALGWISASRASVVSWLLLIVAGLISIPALLLQYELVRVLIVSFVLVILGKFFSKNSYKSNSFGEIILFLLSGPALVSGYQVSLGGGVDTEVLGFGVMWGVAVLFLIHINNFSHLLTSSQAGIRNTMTKFGFDKAQKFLIFWWSLYFILWTLFHILYASKIWTIFGTLILILWSLPLFSKILKIRSPLGSDLDLIRKEAYKTFLLMVFILFAENFWYIGDKLNWKI